MLTALPKILIVDHDVDTLNSFSNRLKKQAYEVHTAQHSEQALYLSQLNFYSAIILECSMPSKSGLQLAIEMKAMQDDSTHFIFMSQTQSDTNFVRSCLKAMGGSRFYIKPFNSLLLIEYLDEVLKGQYRKQLLLERMSTLPNPSASELLDQLSQQSRITGYELPYILMQMARFKVSTQVNLYRGREICLQIQLHFGQIVQMHSYEETSSPAHPGIELLTAFVNAKPLVLQLCPFVANKNYSGTSCTQLRTWAEAMTFSYLPIHWIISRLLPLLAGKIYSTSNHDSKTDRLRLWPVLDDKGVSLDELNGGSLLDHLFSSSRKNEDLFFCLYNYLMNSMAWIDNLKKNYREEEVVQFFAWHYKYIINRNYFEILELTTDQSVDESVMVPLYKRCLKEIKELSLSREVESWIELEGTLLQKAIDTVKQDDKRQIYLEDINNKQKMTRTRLLQEYDKLFTYFANNQPFKVLSSVSLLSDEECWPQEVRHLQVWAKLKTQGASYNQRQLKEFFIDSERLPLSSEHLYLKFCVQALVKKLEGDKYAARRLFKEAQKRNPNLKMIYQEISRLDRPESPVSPWWRQVFHGLVKIIEQKTKSA